jgi:hypothetical protein
VIAGVKDTEDKFMAGDNNKFIAGDNDTGEQLSLMSMTLVINLSLLTMITVIHNCSMISTSPWIYFVFKTAIRRSRTRTPWRWELPRIRESRYPRPPKFDNATNNATKTTIKRRIETPHTLFRDLRQPKLNGSDSVLDTRQRYCCFGLK